MRGIVSGVTYRQNADRVDCLLINLAETHDCGFDMNSPGMKKMGGVNEDGRKKKFQEEGGS